MKEEFINNIFCRRESNQHKARKIWNEEFKLKLQPKIANWFEIEWSHYLLDEFGPGRFSQEIEMLKPYLDEL